MTSVEIAAAVRDASALAKQVETNLRALQTLMTESNAAFRARMASAVGPDRAAEIWAEAQAEALADEREGA